MVKAVAEKPEQELEAKPESKPDSTAAAKPESKSSSKTDSGMTGDGVNDAPALVCSPR